MPAMDDRDVLGVVVVRDHADRMPVQVRLRLPEGVVAAVDEVADAEGRTRAEMLWLLISDGIVLHREQAAGLVPDWR